VPNQNVSHLRGFTKPEGKGFVAICIDLDIVAQGKTMQEATEVCGELIQEYIAFVMHNFPDKVHDYIPRLSPSEIIEEYDSEWPVAVTADSISAVSCLNPIIIRDMRMIAK
jgi:predicted RNase H-like HicB family nuclease